MAATTLEAAHHWIDGRVEIVPITTSGDTITDRPLADIGGKALWTKELDQALLEGRTDASVHSMKDVEAERPAKPGDRRHAAPRRRPRPADRRRFARCLAQGRARRHVLAAPGGAVAARASRPRHPADPRQSRHAARPRSKRARWTRPCLRPPASTGSAGRRSASRSRLTSCCRRRARARSASNAAPTMARPAPSWLASTFT